LELALVLAVSDAEKLTQALESYRTILNKMLDKVRDVVPGSIPEFSIPKPKVDIKGDSKFAYYPIPEQLGLHKELQPTGGLSPTVAVLTLSRSHAEKLLKDAPFKTGFAPLADMSKPLDSVFYFNFAGLVDAAGPWVEYAMKLSGKKNANTEEMGKYALTAMEILKVFRGYVSATYREGGMTITHSEAVFQDIAK